MRQLQLPGEIVDCIFDHVAPPTYEGWRERYNTALSLALVSRTFVARSCAVLQRDIFLKDISFEQLALLARRQPQPRTLRVIAKHYRASASAQFIQEILETLQAEEIWVNACPYTLIIMTGLSREYLVRDRQ